MALPILLYVICSLHLFCRQQFNPEVICISKAMQLLFEKFNIVSLCSRHWRRCNVSSDIVCGERFVCGGVRWFIDYTTLIGTLVQWASAHDFIICSHDLKRVEQGQSHR